MKKNAIIFILLIVVISGGIYFLTQRDEALVLHKTDLLRAVPADAGIIVKCLSFNEMHQALKSNAIWNEIIATASLETLHSVFNQFDSLQEYDPKLKLLLQQEIWASYHLIGKHKIVPVYYLSEQDEGGSKLLMDLLQIYYPNARTTHRNYEQSRIFDVRFKIKDKEIAYSVATKGGVVILSTSGILVENALRQLSVKKHFSDDAGFKSIQKTAGKSAFLNLYIHYGNFNKLIAALFNDQKYGQIKRFVRIADWTELDVSVNEKKLMLNGFTSSADSLNGILNIFRDQQPQRIKVAEILPDNTFQFAAYAFSHKERLNEKYREYLGKHGNFATYSNYFSEIKKSYKVDLESLFIKNLDNEIITSRSASGKGNDAVYRYGILKTKSGSTANEELETLIRTYSESVGQNPDKFIQTYKFDQNAQFRVYRFPFPMFLKYFMGVFNTSVASNYCTVFDNYLIFGDTFESLSNLLYFNVLNKTLVNNIEYLKTTENINSKANFYYYMKLDKAKTLIERNFSDNLANFYTEHHDLFGKINTLNYQFSASDDLFYNNIVVDYTDQKHQPPKTVWETLLDTTIQIKPQFIVNHYTQEKEIVVQDKKNQLYLINRNGRILWKIPLNGKINSEIKQIDYYHNNKLQLIFSTTNNIYLLDREGNNVENYPIKLRSGASAGMNLIDYDGNKKYRIFIPTKDKRVYAYNIEGEVIKGWKFKKSDHIVSKQIQHFRVGTKDYIVFHDKYKTYILNRRGETRVSLKKQFPVSSRNSFTLIENNGPKLLITDTIGNIVTIDFNGKVSRQNLDAFSGKHYFQTADFDADGKRDYIFLDRQKLKILDQKGHELLKYQFESSVQAPPIYFNFSRMDKKIGVYSTQENQIYLFNNNGSLYKDFPVVGNSLFSIGKLNDYAKFNLIVGGKNNFLYNYIVN